MSEMSSRTVLLSLKVTSNFSLEPMVAEARFKCDCYVMVTPNSVRDFPRFVTGGGGRPRFEHFELGGDGEEVGSLERQGCCRREERRGLGGRDEGAQHLVGEGGGLQTDEAERINGDEVGELEEVHPVKQDVLNAGRARTKPVWADGDCRAGRAWWDLADPRMPQRIGFEQKGNCCRFDGDRIEIGRRGGFRGSWTTIRAASAGQVLAGRKVCDVSPNIVALLKYCRRLGKIRRAANRCFAPSVDFLRAKQTTESGRSKWMDMYEVRSKTRGRRALCTAFPSEHWEALFRTQIQGCSGADIPLRIPITPPVGVAELVQSTVLVTSVVEKKQCLWKEDGRVVTLDQMVVEAVGGI
ncbi:hypothetical protein DFH09DRAFT_1089096 [Mycena vulgaris]|nr:hypothetical protein DFH09DRAFT_1089096 [Mycena vulgaris]